MRNVWYNSTCSAGVAHPVERHLAKVEVASSSLVTRSIKRKQMRKHLLFFLSVVGSKARTIKCNASERCARGLDRAQPLFSASAENANEPRHPLHKKKADAKASAFFLSVVGSEARTIKCNADERCARGLDRAQPLFSASAENANEPRHPVLNWDLSFCFQTTHS